jgi:hypothetical protein
MARRWLILRGATPSAIRQYRGSCRRAGQRRLSLNAPLNPRPDCDVSPPVWPFTITGMATSDYGYARNKSASTCQTNLGGIQSLSSTLRRSSGGAYRSKYLPSMVSNFLISASNLGGKSLRTR